MTTSPIKSVLELIYDWSLARPLWQRDALRRIFLRGALSDADIAELVTLCKKENGSPNVALEAKPLTKADLPANPGAGDAVALLGISDVTGVNQLAAKQTLPFEPKGITVIYGDNGAGKSGYARILKRACRARHPGEIMPDAYDAAAAPAARANIGYEVSGKAKSPIAWLDADKPHNVLSAVSVFDRECGTVHVRNKNEVAFRPFGLDIPDELADACQRLRTALTAEQSDLATQRDPAFLKPTWRADSRVGTILSALTAKTKSTPLEALAKVSDASKARHTQLCEDLSKDPLKASSEQVIYANQIRQLALALQKFKRDTSDEVLLSIKGLAFDAVSKRAASELAASKAFEDAALPGVGGEAWRIMWNAARHYAEHIAYSGRPFPISGDDAVCLYCHQKLAPEARKRLLGFDEFVQADIEQQAQDAENTFAKEKAAFAVNRVRTAALGAVRRKISLTNPELGRATMRFLASARLRYFKCEKSLAEHKPDLTLSSFADDPIAELLALESETRAYAQELQLAADAEGRKTLEKERDEIADCIALEILLPKAKAEIERLKSEALISTCLGQTSTNVITRLGNDIADEVITPKMRDQFQNEIVRLAANRVRVEIVRAGGKYGSPFYQVRLFANPKASVHDVLSEGEQTCVALAAFLTELATAAHKSALVFDDPVSSLDHKWRQQVAARLVEEADNRQIIIFTHDLVFLNDVNDAASLQKKAVQLVTLSRTPAGAGTVAMGLPWLAASIPDRVDKMEKDVRSAKREYDSHDDEGYRQSVHRIYSNLRNTWERAVEDVAFGGVINRHRDYVNTKYLRRATALAESDCDVFDVGFQKCCDLTDAHDPSRGRNAAPPPPEEMMRDVQAVLAWVNSIRVRQKTIA
jgi:energy-coupling factor transporter ATP-binding protein EcfA2